MKALDIAWKDLGHSFRSAFALVFMFVVPLLTVALFYLALGGISFDGGLEVSTVEVQLVNLDEPASQAGGFSAGEMLADFLASDELEGLLDVTVVDEETTARTAVDEQRAAVAIVIPPGFTTAMIEPGGRATVELYQDPTLTIGPDIAKGIVNQFIDGFAGSKIATDVIEDQLTERGVTVDARRRQEIILHYAGWSAELGQRLQGGESILIDRRAAGRAEEEGEGMLAQILQPIMTGMMIFYAFFTGASSAQSILTEEEAGTLSRLFTTPTPLSTILGGKLLAVFATLIIQVLVLLVIGALVFRLTWGAPVPAMLMALSLVVLASSFGVFLTSWLKNTEQAGLIFGGVMTVLGMVGINAMFTGGLGGTSKATDVVALFTPQGWAMRGWRIVLHGGDLADAAFTLGVILVLAIVFFAIGVWRFRERFA